MSEDVLVRLENVSKKFCRDLKKSLWYGVQDITNELLGRNGGFRNACLRPKEFWALKDISFQLRKGESLGLIGRNGAGKSTLLKLLNGLIKPNEGRIIVRGRMGALIELGTGFNPILTGRENIYVNAALLGLSKRRVDRNINEIIDFAEIDEFIDTPVQSYSSGMRVRLGFAIAAHLDPDVLLVDEVLAVGDMAFQRKCISHMLKYLENGGVLVLVSHNLHLIQSMCKRCLLLDRGKVDFEGIVTDGVKRYFETQNSSYGYGLATESQVELSEDNPVVIEKVDICPVNGDEIRTGESARLSLYYRATKDFDAVYWNFSIWTRDQSILITTGRARFSNINYRVVRGKGQFKCTIPHLPLVAGTYALKANIFDTKTMFALARIGFDNPPIYFAVKASGGEIDNRRAADVDLVTMDVQWEK